MNATRAMGYSTGIFGHNRMVIEGTEVSVGTEAGLWCSVACGVSDISLRCGFGCCASYFTAFHRLPIQFGAFFAIPLFH
jgi:hypothetical protein